MNKQPGELPAEWFDWLEDYDFDQLTEAQQDLVCAVSDPLTYQEMRESYKLLLTNPLGVTPNAATSSGAGTQLRIQRMYIWQAAAVVLFCSTLYFAFRPQQNGLPFAVQVLHDTIYHTKVVYDTLAIVKTEKPAKPNRRSAPAVATHKQTRYTDGPIPGIGVSGNLDIVKLNTIDDHRNQPKRNSRKDDSLERNFKFVRL